VHTHIKSPQSLGHGKVLPPDTRDESVIFTFLRHMSEKVGYRLRQHNMQAQSFFIGVRSYAWGWMGDKGKTHYPTRDGQKIYQLGRTILDHHWDGSGRATRSRTVNCFSRLATLGETCCSVSSSLLGHAVAVTRWCEAPRTM
jgi:hypothetical protein